MGAGASASEASAEVERGAGALAVPSPLAQQQQQQQQQSRVAAHLRSRLRAVASLRRPTAGPSTLALGQQTPSQLLSVHPPEPEPEPEPVPGERYPGSRWSIFAEGSAEVRTSTKAWARPSLLHSEHNRWMTDPYHPYCLLPHDVAHAQRKRHGVLEAGRAQQRQGRQRLLEQQRQAASEQARALASEKARMIELLAREPAPAPPPPIPELTLGQQLFMSRHSEEITRRQRFDSLMATLSRREIGLSMWNSLQGEEAVYYEQESMRLDAKAAREDECRALATAIFKHFDVDASGQIEREEMLQLVQAIAKTGVGEERGPSSREEEDAKLTPKQISATFFGLVEQLDKDDDNAISSEELVRYFLGLADADNELSFTRRVLRPLREMAKRTYMNPELRRGMIGEVFIKEYD